jgi:transporter family-2 protein
MILLLAAAFLLGVFLPVQVGINAQLRAALAQPVLAAAISFAVGTLALLALAVALRTPVSITTASRVPWWAWTGGLLGAGYILGTILLAPRLGAASLTVAVIAGQLGAALVLDHFGLVGFARQPITLTRAAGAVLLMLGALLVQRR